MARTFIHHGPNWNPLKLTSGDLRIEKITETGCWIWLGRVNESGYGQALRPNGSHGLAHRAFYEAVHGAIERGLVLDHVCRVRLCVNPEHLRAVTRGVNTFAPGSRATAYLNSLKPHCPKCGGEYRVITNKTTGRLSRRCDPCMQKLQNQWRRERYAADPEFRAKIHKRYREDPEYRVLCNERNKAARQRRRERGIVERQT